MDIKTKKAAAAALAKKKKISIQDAARLVADLPEQDVLTLSRGAEGLPVVTGEIVPAEPGELPAAVVDIVDSTLEAFCNKFKIDDLRKASAETWRGACLFVGDAIKKSKAMRDPEREAQGGIVYRPERVEALLDYWQRLTAALDKVPLAQDFVAFSGVSPEYFRGDAGQVLTSSGLGLVQKMRDLQEAGLASRLADGRRNPTGQIFILKNCHGWRDQREVVHTDGPTTAAPAAYPTFAALPDAGGGSSADI